MSNSDIKVNLTIEGMDTFMRDLKKVQAELEKTIALRNRALRPRWLTRLKNFLFGEKANRKRTFQEDTGLLQREAHYQNDGNPLC